MLRIKKCFLDIYFEKFFKQTDYTDIICASQIENKLSIYPKYEK